MDVKESKKQSLKKDILLYSAVVAAASVVIICGSISSSKKKTPVIYYSDSVGSYSADSEKEETESSRVISEADKQKKISPMTKKLSYCLRASARNAKWRYSENEKAPEFPADVNLIEYDELLYIDGIGEVTAQRIIDFREQKGIITSIEMLAEIDGIGEGTIEKLKEYLFVEDDVYIPYVREVITEPAEPEYSYGVSETDQEPERKAVNINTADAEEIADSLLIDIELAEEIVALREQILYFSSIDELELMDSYRKLDISEIKEYILLEQKY